MNFSKSRIKKNYLPFLDDFLLYLQTNNCSEETVYNYERDLSVFENFLSESDIKFNELTKRNIELYKAYLNSIDRQTAKRKKARKKLKSFSINRYLSTLRSYLKYLVRMDLASPIPPDSVSLVKTEKKIPKVAELKDIIKLIEFPSRLEKNPLVAKRNRAMLEMLFSTGMRISELTDLKISQINKNGQVYVMGKGKKERFVYLTPRAQRLLNEYLDTRNDDIPYAFIPYRGRNSASAVKKISPNYIQHKLKQYRELLGINVPTSPHSLRHAFATYLAESGASPAAIQIMLGHESLDTTTRYINASQRFARRVHSQFHPLKN